MGLGGDWCRPSTVVHRCDFSTCRSGWMTWKKQSPIPACFMPPAVSATPMAIEWIQPEKNNYWSRRSIRLIAQTSSPKRLEVPGASSERGDPFRAIGGGFLPE